MQDNEIAAGSTGHSCKSQLQACSQLVANIFLAGVGWSQRFSRRYVALLFFCQIPKDGGRILFPLEIALACPKYTFSNNSYNQRSKV